MYCRYSLYLIFWAPWKKDSLIRFDYRYYITVIRYKKKKILLGEKEKALKFHRLVMIGAKQSKSNSDFSCLLHHLIVKPLTSSFGEKNCITENGLRKIPPRAPRWHGIESENHLRGVANVIGERHVFKLKAFENWIIRSRKFRLLSLF